MAKVKFWPSFANGAITAFGTMAAFGIAGVVMGLVQGQPDEDEESGQTVVNAERVEVQGGATLTAQSSAPSDGDFDEGYSCAGVMQ